MIMNDFIFLSYTLAITYGKSGIPSSLGDKALTPCPLAIYLSQLENLTPDSVFSSWHIPSILQHKFSNISISVHITSYLISLFSLLSLPSVVHKHTLSFGKLRWKKKKIKKKRADIFFLLSGYF